MTNFTDIESVDTLFSTADLAMQLHSGLKLKVEISDEGVTMSSNNENMTPAQASILFLGLAVTSLDAGLRSGDDTLTEQYGRAVIEFSEGVIEVVEDLDNAGAFEPDKPKEPKTGNSLLDDLLEMTPEQLKAFEQGLRDKYGF